jgi:hypothetical protein
VIDGVNHLLNGVDESTDFWPTALVQWGGFPFTQRASVPTPPPSTVDAGFDLFVTNPASRFIFDTIPNPQFVFFQSNPLGTFDFGSGPISVGDADTIVERTQLADLLGGSDTVDIELVALSLVSVDPVDLGFGAGFEDVFLRLNTSSPSIQSTRTIFDTGEGDPHGTFDSTRNVTLDVVGSVGGFYGFFETTSTSSGNRWRHEPGATVINGVNHLLNGVDESADFWPTALVRWQGLQFTQRASVPTSPASLPSLGAVGMALVGSLLGLSGWRRLRAVGRARGNT